MTWLMRLPDGRKVSSDDFTLGDLGRVEDETGVPWSTANPFRSVKTARAFLRAAYVNAGLGPDDVDALTLGTLKRVFEFREDEPWPETGDGEGDDADPPGGSSGGSSSGASDGSGGPRAKPVNNA